jgi:hypothetical protein
MRERAPACGAGGRGLLRITMTGSGGGSTAKPGARKGDVERAERLKAALRENLKRRKAQARARTQPAGSGPAHDSAGIVPEFAGDKPKG